MTILGIESSCDETAAAVIEEKGGRIKVLASVISSQIETFKGYGGVIPEVAARKHVLMIVPVINEAIKKSGIKLPSPRRKGPGRAGEGLDAIAVTAGPGLATSLMVGVETAKTLAFAWGLPLIAVNHIEGHIYANFISPESLSKISAQGGSASGGKNPCLAGRQAKSKIQNNILFPALVLTVSGGHTMLVLMTDYGKYKVIGETRDDAAGEAFDKAARILGLGYPGGPAIAAEAAKIKKSPLRPSRLRLAEADPRSEASKFPISLPRPMINSGNYEFSFSGLKTALLYKAQKDPLYPAEGEAGEEWKKRVPEYCAEFQQAIIDVLITKALKAAAEYKVKTIMLSGGVSANKELRRQMGEAIKKRFFKVRFLVPRPEFTTDNAAMIAAAGYFQAKGRGFSKPEKVIADPGLRL